MQDVVLDLGPRGYLNFTDSIGAIDYKELQVEDKPMAHGSVKSVFRAVWKRHQSGHQENMQVAVLVLRSGQSMASEVKIFERLGRHPNICRLLALTKKPPANQECMVMEFAERGSLDVVLQDMDTEGSESPSSVVLMTAASQVQPEAPPSLRKFLYFCCQYLQICDKEV